MAVLWPVGRGPSPHHQVGRVSLVAVAIRWRPSSDNAANDPPSPSARRPEIMEMWLVDDGVEIVE
jgi:hypothetical protein